ncbi:hypothetical protein [Paraglaciecola chathamensis]|uniref:hypothetical protein n=1 Tax=Paraglaciecola chathamensis TaxID=368405 RepID=UPI00270670A6|nr:hypothetical protein [Paraglaciecola chathamensis]MDO6561673.1 hypothetical protein [Paraglaciecola chathamensis]
MYIECQSCGYREKTNIDFFVKVIGGSLPIGGYWAWTTYLIAGTGFAMAIVVAIIGGGVGILLYKEEILSWILDKQYGCDKCSQINWEIVKGGEDASQRQIIKQLADDSKTTPLQLNKERNLMLSLKKREITFGELKPERNEESLKNIKSSLKDLNIQAELFYQAQEKLKSFTNLPELRGLEIVPTYEQYSARTKSARIVLHLFVLVIGHKHLCHDLSLLQGSPNMAHYLMLRNLVENNKDVLARIREIGMKSATALVTRYIGFEDRIAKEVFADKKNYKISASEKLLSEHGIEYADALEGWYVVDKHGELIYLPTSKDVYFYVLIFISATTVCS